jgi:hypothetical protein
MSCVPGARRMLANGGGSSLGMNSSTSSSLQPLPGAEEFEGLLLEFGKPVHWSVGSFANRRGGLPASGCLLGLFLRCQLGDLVVVDLSCRGGRPSASLRVLLPRDFGQVHHALLARSWKMAQLGAVLRGSGRWSWAPLSSGRVVLQPGWVSAPPFGGGRSFEVRLEGGCGRGKEIMAHLPVPEEDTQKRRRRGVWANLSSIKPSSTASSASTSAEGSWRGWCWKKDCEVL